MQRGGTMRATRPQKRTVATAVQSCTASSAASGWAVGPQLLLGAWIQIRPTRGAILPYHLPVYTDLPWLPDSYLTSHRTACNGVGMAWGE